MNSMSPWSGIISGIVIAMAASGAHSVSKNYIQLKRGGEDGIDQ